MLLVVGMAIVRMVAVVAMVGGSVMSVPVLVRIDVVPFVRISQGRRR